MSLLKLNDIKTPLFPIELPDGTKKDYDLYELGERLSAVKVPQDDDGNIDMGAMYDQIRQAFEFPSAAAAKETGVFTLSRVHCEVLRTAVLKQLSERPERRDFFALVSRWSGSMESSHPNSKS